MFKKIKLLSLLVCPLILIACNSDDDVLLTANAPKQVININSTVYASIRSDATANGLFAALGATELGDEKCDVKIHRMSFDTIGGAGEATSSTGVFMLPHGDNPECNGPLPVMLYAHGTTDIQSYDLSQFAVDPNNDATGEALVMLAAYASKGYALIAPNYAGYSDSPLGYHPYMDEVQQSTEMIDALEHVRTYAGVLGANLSSKLFISGLSQGGYVAMATHKALEAKGETVTASMPVSGPYAIRDFVDTVFSGYVNAGATVFAPMVLTALKYSDDIYSDPSEVYDAKYADIAENSLPSAEGLTKSGLPLAAVFSGEAPEGANVINQMGFGDDHLLADSFREAYLADIATNGDTPIYNIRALMEERDMRDGWQPGAPMLMCGTSSDPVVYYTSTTIMDEYWSDNVYVSSIDMAEQMAGVDIEAMHRTTAVYCAGAGLQYFAKFM